MPMPRQARTRQFDLFPQQLEAESAQTPPWQALPEETRLRLTKLMARLIVDHVDGEHAARPKETRRDA
jgi:hypothetical protein